MPTVNVPGKGMVDFPDTMPEQEIQKIVAQHTQPQEPAQPLIPQAASVTSEPQAARVGEPPAVSGPVAAPQNIQAVQAQAALAKSQVLMKMIQGMSLTPSMAKLMMESLR